MIQSATVSILTAATGRGATNGGSESIYPGHLHRMTAAHCGICRRTLPLIFFHVHFIRPLGHLEDLVMTARARKACSVHVFFMAEDDRVAFFGATVKSPPPICCARATGGIKRQPVITTVTKNFFRSCFSPQAYRITRTPYYNKLSRDVQAFLSSLAHEPTIPIITQDPDVL